MNFSENLLKKWKSRLEEERSKTPEEKREELEKWYTLQRAAEKKLDEDRHQFVLRWQQARQSTTPDKVCENATSSEKVKDTLEFLRKKFENFVDTVYLSNCDVAYFELDIYQSGCENISTGAVYCYFTVCYNHNFYTQIADKEMLDLRWETVEEAVTAIRTAEETEGSKKENDPRFDFEVKKIDLPRIENGYSIRVKGISFG